MRRFSAGLLSFILVAVSVSACTRTANAPEWTPVLPQANRQFPTFSPVLTYLPPTRGAGTPISSPTPDGGVTFLLPTFTALPTGMLISAATPTAGPLTYTVQSGDYPSSIAQQYGISVDGLLQANSLGANDLIYPGQQLVIPLTVTPGASATADNSGVTISSDYFKVIPDSELVYGPLSALLDVNAFVQKRGGYLSFYKGNADGATLSGAQMVDKVAREYSVNPRLLLAVLEYRSQWVTNANPAPSTLDTPIGKVDNFYVGLYRQLAWAAIGLNEGFYGWREGKIKQFTLADGTTVVPQPGINAGTAGVENLFAKLDDQTSWKMDTGPNGLFATYSALFGYPFDLAVEPLLPPNLSQPTLALPFQSGEVWQFTGGPHAGWDSGSAWAALDFAPPGAPVGCNPVDYWVTASADGVITRAGDGAVIEDLDGDGLEQTGWTILYMHIEDRDRVQAGTHVQTGDRIGHPSCQGGEATADHVHIARRYNGVWIAADDPSLPFTMDGWVASGDGTEYDGTLTKGGQTVEAWDGQNSLNQISH